MMIIIGYLMELDNLLILILCMKLLYLNKHMVSLLYIKKMNDILEII